MYNRIKNLMETGQNIFITGSAGTGKSYNLKLLRDDFYDLEVTASTGVAAVNVGGTTIHHYAGIGLGDKPIDMIINRMHPDTTMRIKYCGMLAIDEISMLSAETFTLINEVFKRVRQSDAPFGGMQLIVIGDFLQLPPVSRGEDIKNFAFTSKAWEEAGFHTIKLEKCYRQKDIAFLDILKRIRNGDQVDLGPFINGVYNEKNIHLFAVNKLADDFNFERLRRIKNKQHYFKAKDSGSPEGIEMIQKWARASQDLFLKVDTRVMLLNNKDVESGLVNGAVGTVLEINGDSVTVQFDNKIVCNISYEKVDSISKKHVEIASREQIPLMLAYAITIHKSQGMTLKNVHIDGRGIFEYGQAYVAFSRVESPQGLHVKYFNPGTIKAHPKAVQFYEEF
jgi:ATP-dependent DNA helicase PIF1